MATRNDVISRAAFNLNMRRQGQSLPGNVYSEVLANYTACLAEIDETLSHSGDGLDWEYGEDEVPAAREDSLVQLMMYHPSLDRFDTRRTLSERAILYQGAKKRLMSLINAPSDHVEQVENF